MERAHKVMVTGRENIHGLRHVITVFIGDLRLTKDVMCDRDIRLAKRLADDHQATFMYDDETAHAVRCALGTSSDF